MGDYDDGREMGLWGDDGIPYWDGDDESEKRKKGYIVSLTPSKYLKKYQKDKRIALWHKRSSKGYISLELVHNRFNERDKYALEVYFEDVFIGYLRKKYDDHDKTTEINKMCFLNGFLREVRIEHLSGDKVSIMESKTVSDLDWRYGTLREKTDIILFKNNAVPMQDTEAITIKYALQHKELYSFNDEEIANLKTRLAKIALEQSGAAGREIGTAAIDATEKILTETFDLGGKTLKFFGFNK